MRWLISGVQALWEIVQTTRSTAADYVSHRKEVAEEIEDVVHIHKGPPCSNMC